MRDATSPRQCAMPPTGLRISVSRCCIRQLSLEMRALQAEPSMLVALALDICVEVVPSGSWAVHVQKLLPSRIAAD
eukprot:6178241-Pleurochrysis_carterae.AAC.2